MCILILDFIKDDLEKRRPQPGDHKATEEEVEGLSAQHLIVPKECEIKSAYKDKTDDDDTWVKYWGLHPEDPRWDKSEAALAVTYTWLGLKGSTCCSSKYHVCAAFSGCPQPFGCEFYQGYGLVKIIQRRIREQGN